jgi:hypothetical protein
MAQRFVTPRECSAGLSLALTLINHVKLLQVPPGVLNSGDECHNRSCVMDRYLISSEPIGSLIIAQSTKHARSF